MAMVTSFLGNGEDGYNYIIEADDDAPMQKMQKWLHSFFLGCDVRFIGTYFMTKSFDKFRSHDQNRVLCELM